jgi:hypothetical protein
MNENTFPLQQLASDKINLLPKNENKFPLQRIPFNKVSAIQSAKLYFIA